MARDLTPNTGQLTIPNYSALSNVDLETYSIWCYQMGQAGTDGRLFDDDTQRLVMIKESNGNRLRLVGRRYSTPGKWNWPALTDNVWQCVQITLDNSSTSNKPELYLDGVNQTRVEENAASGTLDTSDKDVHVGNNSSGIRGFDGRLAEVALWNRILSVSELETVRIFGPARVNNGLIMYLPLWGTTSPEPNLAPEVGRTQCTVVGTTAVAPHPPVANPFAQSLGYNKPVAAAAPAARRVILVS